MAQAGSRRTPAPIKTLTPAALALGLVALAAGTAPGKGGYWKSQCDMAKNAITSAKTAAMNNKIAAFNAVPPANAAAKKAEDAYAANSGSMSGERKARYAACMKAGADSMATGTAHRNAAEWRYNEGTAKYLAGESFYTAYNYTAAYAEYTNPTEPIGSLQHFQRARDDWYSEYLSYVYARGQYESAYQACQPPY